MAGNGVTLILNSASIQRFKLFGALTYTSLSVNRLKILGQMSADSNTPFAFAIFASTTGNQTNASFTFVGSPSSGFPVMGSGNVLLHSGWSAFALSVANPFFMDLDIPAGFLSGSYEIWVMAQNFTSPSVSGYLGLGVTLQLGTATNVNIQQVGAADVPGTSVPVDVHSIGGGIMVGNTVDVALVKVGGVSQTTAVIATDLVKVGGTSTASGSIQTQILSGSGSPNLAIVDATGSIKTVGGGSAASVYLTDSTGTIPVQVSSHGSLAIVNSI